MEAKAHHFSAVSEYRESIVEYEASRSAFQILLITKKTAHLDGRYGVELARLSKALVAAKNAYNVAHKGRVAPTIVQDAQVWLNGWAKLPFNLQTVSSRDDYYQRSQGSTR
jgi:programmed cell death 6-interacting protein